MISRNRGIDLDPDFSLQISGSKSSPLFIVICNEHDLKKQSQEIRSSLAAYNHGHNILRTFDVRPTFPFTKSERKVITSNKHDVYELPHNLLNGLELRKLENIRKISKPHRIIAQCSVFLLKLFNTFKKHLKIEIISAIRFIAYCLRLFPITESSLKMMENAFCFILKAIFVFKISAFLSGLFGHLVRRMA